MSSNETLIAEVRQSRRTELVDQGRQTDQLMVLQGSIDLIMLLSSWFRRITLCEDNPAWVLIKPGVPHGGLQHGPSDARDDAHTNPAVLAADWSQPGHTSSLIPGYA